MRLLVRSREYSNLSRLDARYGRLKHYARVLCNVDTVFKIKVCKSLVLDSLIFHVWFLFGCVRNAGDLVSVF